MTALSEEGWAQLLLVDMGAPTTANNVGNIERWMTAEEPTSDWYDRDNPLNSSYRTGGPGDGTGSYPTLQAAAAADAAQITEAGTTPKGVDTGDKYTGIYDALVGDDSTAVFAAAVEASPWASSHYADDPIADIPVPAGTVTDPASSSTSDPTATADTPTPAAAPTAALTSVVGDLLHPEKSILAIGVEILALAAAVGLVILGAVKTVAPNSQPVAKAAGSAKDAAVDAALA